MGENADRIREGYERFNQGDLKGMVAMLDPDVEWSDSTLNPDMKLYFGRDGVRRWFEDMAEAWIDLRCDPVEVSEEQGGVVMAICRFTGRGRGSGLELDALVRHRWVMREGMPVKANFFWHLAESDA